MLMMSIRQLKERKKELGYTNEMVAEKSGVPLSTVQKIFCGATRHPRYDTLLALTKALSEYNYDLATYVVQEEARNIRSNMKGRFRRIPTPAGQGRGITRCRISVRFPMRSESS